MRAATNQTGFQIEKLTPYGWCVTFDSASNPYADRAAADAALADFKVAAPLVEWRVMPVLEGGTCG